MKKKQKLIQLNAFDPAVMPSASADTDAYWQRFLPTVKKLHKAGHKSGCEVWWRSRYSDFLTNTNTAPKNHEEWAWRYLGFQLWKGIWEKHKKEMAI